MVKLHKIIEEEKFFFQNDSNYEYPFRGIYTRYTLLDQDLPIWVNREGRLQSTSERIKLEQVYTELVIEQNG